MSKIGNIDEYDCGSCLSTTITKQVHEGKLPLNIPCGVCGGEASIVLTEVNQDQEPQWEWYRPRREDRRRMTGPARKHVDAGGLLMRSVRK